LPVEEESLDGVLSIRILGPGCYTCDKMEKDAREVTSELGIAADIQHIRDVDKIVEYGPGIYPALIINNTLYASGKAPSRQQLRIWLEELIDKK
jgi:small redox-active disulfide protein 2